MPSNKGNQILIGADPEVFLQKNEDNLMVSAEGIIPGTKSSIHKFSSGYGGCHVDGVAAEINIKPAATAEHFVLFLQDCLSNLKSLSQDYSLKIQPVTVFNTTEWGNIPETSKILGCNPDYNAWTGAINPTPNPPESSTMRTGAGHIHIGWGSGFDVNSSIHFEDCALLARQLDYYMGVPSLLWDTDNRRRSMYGKAGAFRPKPYGLEYRTLSNAWLRYPDLYRWIWYAAHYACKGLITGSSEIVEEKFGDLARKVIDNNKLDYVKGDEYWNKVWKYIPLVRPEWKGKRKHPVKSVKKVPGVGWI